MTKKECGNNEEENGDDRRNTGIAKGVSPKLYKLNKLNKKNGPCGPLEEMKLVFIS